MRCDARCRLMDAEGKNVVGRRDVSRGGFYMRRARRACSVRNRGSLAPRLSRRGNCVRYVHISRILFSIRYFIRNSIHAVSSHRGVFSKNCQIRSLKRISRRIQRESELWPFADKKISRRYWREQTCIVTTPSIVLEGKFERGNDEPSRDFRPTDGRMNSLSSRSRHRRGEIPTIIIPPPPFLNVSAHTPYSQPWRRRNEPSDATPDENKRNLL